MKSFKTGTILLLFTLNLIIFSQPVFSSNNATTPRLVNYYLDQLYPGIAPQLARYNVIVLSPAQILIHVPIIEEIKRLNPSIVIFAYVPSQSYNTTYWPHDQVYSGIRVRNEWWIHDSKGAIVSGWPGIQNINLSPDWSDYFLSYVKNTIVGLPHVDGLFFDMVSSNISWLNHGDIDIDGDGVRDSASVADGLWLSRTQYFLGRAREMFPNVPIVINGTSDGTVQRFVNGRMFETFPTPWENHGEWGSIMNQTKQVLSQNQKPSFVLYNGNTQNTGEQNQRVVRFGLGSALLGDAYFGYDYGDQDHGQLWWYDEYNVSLGKPLSVAVSKNNFTTYKPDLWRRDFEHGIALVNSTPEMINVDLGGEYEKINGKLDPAVNDGSIVSETEVGANDGLILLKTASSLNDVLFTNGSFARFYRPDGTRVRNGFFVFEDAYKGGDQILHLDLDGDGQRDLLVASGNKITASRADGQPLFKVYPYTASYTGSLRLAVGDLDGDGQKEIYVAPTSGAQPIKLYNLIGEEILPQGWYPFDKKYAGGYSLATVGNHLIVGAGTNHVPTISVYDPGLKKVGEWLAFDKKYIGGVTVAASDNDGTAKIAAGFGPGPDAHIKFFSIDGKEVSKPLVLKNISVKNAQLQLNDVDFDGKSDVILMTNNGL